nr:androgen-dependent TFPI-regulating protein-like [Onthophagus taurus]XP_022913858.1 androgen-dependent TFPI-regulating protein-like [Onthophagus taurus]
METPKNRNKMECLEVWVHTLLFAHHSFASIYLNTQIDLSKSKYVQVTDMQNYKYRYFTCWNFVLQTLYLGMVCLYHLLKIFPQTKSLIKTQKVISNIRSFVFTSWVFPTGMLVASIFWTVWYINRELVLPSAADELFPSWINHCIHTNILFVLLAEIFFCKKLPSFKDAVKGALIFCLAYNVNFFFTYYQTSRWLYGMFAVLSWPERLIFMAFNFLLSVILIRISMVIQRNIHQKKLSESGNHKLISKKLL